MTFKLSVTITLMIAVLMLGMGAMTFIVNQRVLVQQETSQGISIGNLAVEMMTPQVTSGNISGLTASIGVLKSDAKVIQAYVTDAAGEVIAHEQPESIGNRMQSRALENAMEHGVLQRQQTVSDSGTPVLLFVAPIINSTGKVLGYLHYTTDFAPALAFMQESAMQWVKVFVGAVLIALILIRIVVVKAVGKPVKQLLSATGRASVGDFSQELEPMANDELGQLSEGFNLMNHQLGILFRSIHQTVEEMDFASQQIVNRSQTLSEADENWPTEKKQEWMKEILSNGKRLVRVSDKLKAFLNQFQVKDDMNG